MQANQQFLSLKGTEIQQPQDHRMQPAPAALLWHMAQVYEKAGRTMTPGSCFLRITPLCHPTPVAHHTAMSTPIITQVQSVTFGGVSSDTTHDEVAMAAFALYREDGYQDGGDVQNWLDAEARVKARHASVQPGHVGQRTGTIHYAIDA